MKEAAKAKGEAAAEQKAAEELAKAWRGDPSLLTLIADEALRAGVGLFVVPGALDAPGKATAVVLIDLDEGDIDAKAAHLAQHLGAPTLDVLSGGHTADGTCKRHLYRRLTAVARGNEIAEACRLRSLQPVRVAGSIHGKHGVSSAVTIRDISATRYDLASLIEGAGKLPPFPNLPSKNLKLANASIACRPPIAEILVQPVREGGVNGITRFDVLSTVIGHFIREARLGRISLAEARDRVEKYNAGMVVPPWPEDRLRVEFRSHEQKDRLQHDWTVAAAKTPETGLLITEDALADRFSELRAPDRRYVAVWPAWLKWAGTRWQIDTAGEVFEEIRLICRAAAVSAQAADIRRICSDRTIRAVERIARSDPRHAALPEEFDADMMLLNTPAGVVDLRTGEIGPHLRAAAMTRQTAASPGSGCAVWEEFLDEITGGDPALLAYLARVAGYCLSGDMSEQVFFFLHGAGANGKSVFLSVLADVLGDYGVTAPLETFMVGKGERHPTDLAGLRGARLVTVNETESGRAWAESRIKAITGGDKLRVRFMHRDFFEFQPAFKLLIAGNHRPRLSGVGEAMRRRLHLVPFEVTIPPERRDRQLLSRLIAERDGILGWMLDGCAEWRRLATHDVFCGWLPRCKGVIDVFWRGGRGTVFCPAC